MEARSFFENSPMREITVTATPEEWRAVLLQLNFVEGYWVKEALDLEIQLNAFGVEVA